jgi:hypothetical protein
MKKIIILISLPLFILVGVSVYSKAPTPYTIKQIIQATMMILIPRNLLPSKKHQLPMQIIKMLIAIHTTKTIKRQLIDGLCGLL